MNALVAADSAVGVESKEVLFYISVIKNRKKASSQSHFVFSSLIYDDRLVILRWAIVRT